MRADRVGDQIAFAITDSGCGVPAGMLVPIFQRFWRVGTNDRRGLGLGLYISRCIIEAHGGTIRAESEPGRGCTVRFTVPVAAMPRLTGELSTLRTARRRGDVIRWRARLMRLDGSGGIRARLRRRAACRWRRFRSVLRGCGP